MVTYLLCIPINLIIHHLTGINNLSAYLPPVAAVILVAISVALTLIPGLILEKRGEERPCSCTEKRINALFIYA